MIFFNLGATSTMKFSKAFTLLLVGLTISHPLWAKSLTSTYTNLKKCQLIEQGHDWSVSKCPSQKAYQLYINYADSRDWLVIKKDGKVVIDLQNDIWNQAPANFQRFRGQWNGVLKKTQLLLSSSEYLALTVLRRSQNYLLSD